jgi:hypothetical protein
MARFAGSSNQSAPARRVGDWMHRLRDRLRPQAYVDYMDIPEGPQSPYRARLTLLPEQGPSGEDVQSREVVRGEMKVVYEIRCACGKRWFNPRLERIQLCPRCDRAVLLQDSE